MIHNKTAIVTGAARGIGFGIAKQLASEGYSIAIFDVLKEESVKENISELMAMGQKIIYFEGNLKEGTCRTAFLDKVMEEFGRIDVLVNNAGVAPKVRLDILETTEESFDFVMDINLKGTFFLTQAVANIMIKETEEPQFKKENIMPVIINIASNSAYTSSPSRGEYCISKAGISMITKLFADRLAENLINVYEVRPGIIATDMTKVVTEKYDKLISGGLTPIKRWGTPEDIAKAVSVFASGKLAFSTGEVINVDGGFHLRRL